MDLKRDKIALIQTGVDPDRMVALENKAIDAAMLQLVATKVMTAKGYFQLLNMYKTKSLSEHRPGDQKDYGSHQRENIDGLTHAHHRSVRIYFYKENKQAVKEIDRAESSFA